LKIRVTAVTTARRRSLDRYATRCREFVVVARRIAVPGAQSAPKDTGHQPRSLAGMSVGQAPWLVLLLLLAAGCGGKGNVVPTNTANPDRFLFDRGTKALSERKWSNAREYFRQVVDNYPNSPHRPDAKLGVGDTYLGEKTSESLVLSANEYREFLTFYPTNPRADYAQYKLAMTHFEQMRAPERDQTETQAALREFQIFFDRYPMSPLIGEVRMKWREARDRLSRAEFRVGFHYYRIKWYVGAIPRFRRVLEEDPGYSGRDEVYFYLAESLARTDKKAEAIPYFQRLLTEFDASEHLEDAKRRLEELKSQEVKSQ
jgi:outer membrane protein assembly factor BamD